MNHELITKEIFCNFSIVILCMFLFVSCGDFSSVEFVFFLFGSKWEEKKSDWGIIVWFSVPGALSMGGCENDYLIHIGNVTMETGKLHYISVLFIIKVPEKMCSGLTLMWIWCNWRKSSFIPLSYLYFYLWFTPISRNK